MASMKEKVDQIKEDRKNVPRKYRKGGFTVGDVKIMGKLSDYADLSAFGLPEKAKDNITWDMFIRLINNRIIEGPDITDDTLIEEFSEAASFLVESSKEIS